MQCSFHKGDGFFPGTGDEDDIGEQLGYGYSVNVPLKVRTYQLQVTACFPTLMLGVWFGAHNKLVQDGTTDKLFHSLFNPIISKIIDVYDPGAIVLQCGADSLAADRLGNFSMTISGVSLGVRCFLFIRALQASVWLPWNVKYRTRTHAMAMCLTSSDVQQLPRMCRSL